MADLVGRGAAFGKVKKSKMQNSEDRLRTQTKTFRKWANVHLPPSEQFAEGELISGLHDGTRLCALASGLSGRTIKVRPREKIKNKIHKLENLSVGLRALGKMGVDVATIDASMIHDGKINMILGMLWRTIIFTMANDIGGGTGSGGAAAKKGLQQWVKRTCKPMGIKVKNFSSSFRDGKIFGAMIAAVRPDLLKMESLEGVDDRQNIERIFAIAKNELNIPALIDADDLLCSSPDEKSVVTQVAEWFKALSELSQAAASTQSIVDAAACAQRHRVQAVAFETDAIALAAWIAAQRERLGAASIALDAPPAESELWTSEAVRSALDALYSWRAADKAAHAATLQQLDAALIVLHASQRHNERELFEVSDPETASTAALQSAWGELEDLEQAYAAALLARLALCRHTDQTMRFINSIATRARESIDDAAAALAASETPEALAQHNGVDAIEEAIAQHRGAVAAAERTQGEIAGIDEYVAALHPMVRSAAEKLSASLVEDSAQLVAATASKSEALEVELVEEKLRAEKEAEYNAEAQQFLREAEVFATDLVAPIPADTLPILEQQLTRIREANIEALVARLPTLREQHAVLCEASPAGRGPAPVAAQYDLAVLEKTFCDLESGALQREEELVVRCDAQRALVEAAVQDYDDTAATLAEWVHETDARLVQTDGAVNAAVYHTHAGAVAEAQKEVEEIEEEWRTHRAALDALPFKLAKVAETRETHSLEEFQPELTPTDLGHTWAIVEAKIRTTQATLRDAEFKVNRSAQRADRLRAALDEHDEWVAQQQQVLGLATIETKVEKLQPLQSADGTATLAGIQTRSDAKGVPTIAAMVVTLRTLQGADDVAVIAELEDGNGTEGAVAISAMIESLKTLQRAEGIAAIAALEDGHTPKELATISSMIATLETVQGASDIAVIAGLQDGGEAKGAPTIATMIATLQILQAADDIAVVTAIQEEGGDETEGVVTISAMLTTLRALQGSGGDAVVRALEDGGAESGEATIAAMITSLETLRSADGMACVSGLREEGDEVEGVTTIATMITTLQSLEGDAPTAAALRMCIATTTTVDGEGETERTESGAVGLDGLATIANMIETLESLQNDSGVRAALESSPDIADADDEGDDGDEIAIDLEGDESTDAIVGAITDADRSEAVFGRERRNGESDEPTLAACESELRAIAAFEQKMKRREQLFPVDATLAARISETKERYEATAELAREKAVALVKQIEEGTARAHAARKVSEEAEALLDDIDVLGEHLEEPMWAGDAISRIEARRVETEEVLATELPERAGRLAKLRVQCAEEAANDDSALASIVQAEQRLETARAKARELIDALAAQLSCERAKAEDSLTDGVAELRVISEATDQWLCDGERDFLPGKERSDAKLLLAKEMHAKDLIDADELEDIAERLMRPAMLLAPRGDEHALIFRSSEEAAAAKAKLDAWVGRTDERQAAMHVMRQIPRRVDAARERHDDIASFAESDEAIDFAPGHRLSPGTLQTRFEEVQAGVESYAELLAYATRELAVADHSANIITSRSAKLAAWCERCSADAVDAAAGAAVGHTPASTDAELLGCRLLLARLETRAKAAEGVTKLHESIDPTYYRHDEMNALASETNSAIVECTRAVGESVTTIEGVLAINTELKSLDGAYITDAETLLASVDGVEQLAAEAMIELDGGEDAASIPVIERTLASLEYALKSEVSEWQPQEEALAEKFTQMNALVEASDAQQDFDPHSALAGRYAGIELSDRSAAARASLEKARDDAIALLAVLNESAERVWTDGRAEYADVFGDLTKWIEESGAKFDAMDATDDAEAVDAELKRWAAEEMVERRVQLHSLASIVHGINGHMQRHERDHYIPDELVIIEVVEHKWEDLLKKTSRTRAEVAKRQLVTERNAFVLNSIDEKRGLVLTWVDEQEALLAEETKTDGRPKRRGRRASLVALRDYVAATEVFDTEEKTVPEETDAHTGEADVEAEVEVESGADAVENDAALQTLSQVDTPDGAPPPRPPAAEKRLRRNSLELAKQGLLSPEKIASIASMDVQEDGADAAEGGVAGSRSVVESSEGAIKTPEDVTGEDIGEVAEESIGASGQVQAAIAKIEEAQKRAAAEKEAAAPSPMELAAGRMAILEAQISRCALAEQQHGQFLAMVTDAEASQTALAERLDEVGDVAAASKLAETLTETTQAKERMANVGETLHTQREKLVAKLEAEQTAMKRARVAAASAATILHELDSAMLEVRAPLADSVEKLEEQRAAVQRIAATEIPGFDDRIGSMEATLGVVATSAIEESEGGAPSESTAPKAEVVSEETIAAATALMRPNQRPAMLRWAHSEAAEVCQSRTEEITELIESMSKQEELRKEFAGAAVKQVNFINELTALITTYARGEDIDDAVAEAESSIAAAKAAEASEGAESAEGAGTVVDEADAFDAIFEDARAVELRRRLLAISTLEQRTEAYTRGPLADMKEAHAQCDEAECAEDNPHTPETLATLRMRWDELLRIVERSRSSIESSLEALKRAGLTKAQIKDLKKTFKNFATVAEEEAQDSSSVDDSDAEECAPAAAPGASDDADGGAEGGRSRSGAMAEPGLTPQDFLNAATALGISLPSDEAAVAAVFDAAAAAEGAVRMDLPAFATFVRLKLGASASKEDVMRALESLAEKDQSEGEECVSTKTIRPVFGDDVELANFVFELYGAREGVVLPRTSPAATAEVAEGAGADFGADAAEEEVSVALDYRKLALALFSV